MQKIMISVKKFKLRKVDLMVSFLLAFVFPLLSNAIIIPSSQSGTTNDPLGNYQWALKTQGQIIYRDESDITHSTVQARPGFSADVQVDPVVITKAMKKIVRVAVLDSGVDLSHPDLQDNLFRNNPECINGKIPFKPGTDNDHNGFAGDCSGWNFTALVGSSIENNPDDDMGHGTFVTGIIAASVNNQIGVSGLSNKIQFIPLKVTSKTDTDINAPIQLTQRVIKALKYAKMMGAEVIHISLGWPQVTSTPELQATFKDIIDSGIIVVAAAGNNNNSSYNYPCAYPGVICVASNGLDNQLILSSNYGGQVDMAAPGEEIISTYPVSMRQKRFSQKGYDLDNGTSEAAPFVSGAVAILKGIYPNITPDEIKARLFLSSQPLTPTNEIAKKKFIQFGTLKIQNAIDIQPQPLIVPEFKKLQRVQFNIKSPDSVPFDLELKNYWKAQNAVQIVVESLSPDFSIRSGGRQIISFKNNESKIIHLIGSLRDISANKEVRLRVSVRQDRNHIRQFSHFIEMSRSIADDSQLIHIPFVPATANQSASVLRNLLSIDDPIGIADNPSYYRSINSDHTPSLYLSHLVGHQYLEKSIDLPAHTQGVIKTLKVPLQNSYGYMIESFGTVADGTSRVLRFQFLDKELRPTSNQSAIEFFPESAALDKDGFASIHFTSIILNGVSIECPVFITNGNIPKLDKNPNQFAFEGNKSSRRVYFLEPFQQQGVVQFRTRLFDNYKFVTDISKQLGLSYQDDLNLVGFLPQSKLDTEHFKIIYSYGRGAFQKYVVVETSGTQLINHGFQLIKANFSSTTLNTGVLAPVTNLDGIPLKNSAASIATFDTPVYSENAFFSPTGIDIVMNAQLQASTQQDYILSYIQSYSKNGQFISVAQTKSNLLFQVDDGQHVDRQQISIHRATWPGVNSSVMLYPSIAKKGNEWIPAIYVDARAMYSNNIYFWLLNSQQKLIAPAQFNIDVPEQCRPLVPQYFKSINQVNAAVFICSDNTQNPELRILPVSF